MKGKYKRSPETIEKIRQAHLGKKLSEEHKRKIGEANKLSCTPETRKRYSEMYKGKKRPNFSGEKHPLWGTHHSKETRLKISQGNKGKKMPRDVVERVSGKLRGRKRPPFSEETIERMSIAHTGKNKGEKNHSWKGGISSERDKIRKSPEYYKWSRLVMRRDKFTCQKTGQVGGKLVAHHILNFSSYPELRFDISNGITLSKEAHMEFHTKYKKRNNTREQLEEFLLV